MLALKLEDDLKVYVNGKEGTRSISEAATYSDKFKCSQNNVVSNIFTVPVSRISLNPNSVDLTSGKVGYFGISKGMTAPVLKNFTKKLLSSI